MAYRVDYGPERKKEKKQTGSGLRISLLTIMFLLIFVVTVNCTWPAGREKLQELLLPGNPSSEQAFSELISDLKGGESFSDAVTAFCRSILEDAKLPNENYAAG